MLQWNGIDRLAERIARKQNKTPESDYAIYRRLTLNLSTFIDRKWKNEAGVGHGGEGR